MKDYCVINSGDFVPALNPPKWTPYAQAIAAHYAIQVPLFITVPTTLTGVALQRRTVVTDPFEYDALILGAMIQRGTDSDLGQTVFLDVFDQKSGINWVCPNIVGGAPLTAFGGQGDQPTSVMRLPEAFFLPARTRMQHEFTQPTGALATGGSITWVGVQLINPFQNRAPEWVKMPNGNDIRVGSRMPWLCTMGLGFRFFAAGAITFSFTLGQSILLYTPPIDCPLEIHDLHSTSFSIEGTTGDPDSQVTKLAVSRMREMWTPEQSPFTAVFGDRTQVFPALPLVKPLHLDPFERLVFRCQNNDATGIGINRVIVARGVRLCQF